MIKKYYSFFLILTSIIVVGLVFYFEKKISNNIQSQQKQEVPEEKIEDKSLISKKIEPGTSLVLKEKITIKGGSTCEWIMKDCTACGIYTKKTLFQKNLDKGTGLDVQWVTSKRVLLPGLTFSIEDQDTVILTKTKSGLEVYIIIIQGENLKITKKRNKYYYSGDLITTATMKNLEEIFDIRHNK